MDPRSHGAYARRLLVATLAAAAVALTSLVLHADIVVPPTGKARLLSRTPREPIVRDALRTRGPRTIDRTAYVPAHVVVKFAPDTSERAMSAIAADVGARAVRRPSYADFTYVELPADVDVETAARELASKPGVIYAEPDARVFTTFTPTRLPTCRARRRPHSRG